MQQDKDNLEQFIVENRAAFDGKEPNERVWSNIESKLESKAQPTLWYWKAAVFLLIGAVGFLLANKYSTKKNQVAGVEELAQESNLEKFEELEMFYASIISNKSEKLSQELSESDDIFNYLEADIEELDVIYKDLKEVFIESQQSDEILDRLIHLLRQKIHMLNSQLDILDRDRLPYDMKQDLNRSI